MIGKLVQICNGKTEGYGVIFWIGAECVRVHMFRGFKKGLLVHRDNLVPFDDSFVVYV